MPKAQGVAGAPCWVSLLARELPGAQDFYGKVLGWTYRRAGLGDDFSVALIDGLPVAGIGALASSLQVAVSWTPYFNVTDVDEAAARIRERGGTVGVGPLAFHTGRAALAVDPDGAVFGIWEGSVRSDWSMGRGSGSASLELRTRDAVTAGRFYSLALGWEPEGEGKLRLVREQELSLLLDGDEELARISGGAVQAAPDPQIRPRWHVRFNVKDVGAAVETALASGGSLVPGPDASVEVDGATLRDPDGALFTVTAAS
ncbi:VOC family protein [Streptomyces sp. IB2014 016-6]|uniref:VOC family protein n=1 Tax=Streptomyces sp. IB2014 016-6 TaxID=2517818 RepID=UPI00164F95D3|nr:VOC family protein [Streptomyces sp. IB2014 016-6]